MNTLARLGYEFAFLNQDSSRYYSQRALEIANKIGYVKGHADALNNLAITYDIQGQYRLALDLYDQAKEKYEAIEDKIGMARIYNNCGIVYQNIGQLVLSLDCHQKSLALERELGNNIGAAYSMLHIAGLNVELSDYPNAEFYYDAANRILQSTNDSLGISYYYLGMGKMSYLTNKAQVAIDELNRALKIFHKIDDNNGVSEACLYIGKSHLSKRRYAAAEEQLKGALKKARELNSLRIAKQCLDALVRCYKEQGMFDKAFDHLEQSNILADSLRSEEMSKNIQEVESRLKLQSKEQEIQLLSAERDYETVLRNISIGVTLTILVLLFILYRSYTVNSKSLSILKTKNKEIREKNNLIEIEKKNAIEAAKVKSEFLSVMSHEIRTPMNAVIGSIHLLMHKNPKPDQIDNLQTLKISAENLLVLINEILDVNKIESGNLEIESIPFKLKDTLDALKSIHKQIAADKDVQLHIYKHDDVEDEYVGDPVRLGQVLNNLLGNAIKFTEEGYVNLNVTKIATGKKNHTLRFDVIDTGIGISESKISVIFDSFSQADSDTTRKYGGSGLGLYITKKLLELFNTKIYVQSALGEGSRFYFDMNFDLVLNRTSNVKVSINDKLKEIEGKSVLVVDDDKVNLVISDGLFKRWGMRCITVAGGEEALIKLKDHTFDIILLDIRMPKMNGFQVSEKIRALDDDAKRNTPIIALSANAVGSVIEEINSSMMTDYLTKPYNPDHLVDMIHQYTTKPVQANY